MDPSHKQIGEVAERTHLSLRTIRYYEEVGLVVPSARSQGGFRLYSDADVERLLLVRRMKPLDFSLDEMRDLLQTLDALEDPTTTEAGRAEHLERLAMFRLATEQRCESLRAQLDAAEEFTARLRHAAQDAARPRTAHA